jgi:hypothetical protein
MDEIGLWRPYCRTTPREHKGIEQGETHTSIFQQTFTAADAPDYLEKVVGAIRERRLYGFMLQEHGETAVGAGQWIKKTIEEVVAEATADNVAVRLPNIQRIKLRHDD